jgi:hypothetical protein
MVHGFARWVLPRTGKAIASQARVRVALSALLWMTLLIALVPFRASAADSTTPDSKELREIRRELQGLEKKVDRLEKRNSDLETDNQRLQATTQQLETTNQQFQATSQKFETQTAEQVKVLETKVEAGPSPSALQSALSGFWGDNRFVLAGDFAVDYKWNDRTHTNSFSLENFAPIFLYQAGERLLFEGEVEFKLTSDGSDTPELEYAQADYILNDYMTIVAGKFTLPFGDFFEREHQKWIMKLVDRPLPYRNPDQGGIMQDNGVGVQVRGGVPLGYGEGAFLDYSVYVANGPSYESAAPGVFLADNHVDNNQGKGYGARIGLDLLPIACQMGRLHLSASTFDGEWDSKTPTNHGDNHWLTSWGLGLDYQKLPFELRGEYLSTSRGMPAPLHADKREGWYLEASYMLNELPVDFLKRMELDARWSGVNQNVIAADDSFTAFTRKPRQIAFGLDYWLAPSKVIKLEYERVIQYQGRDFNALLTSFAYGF